MPFYEYDCAHCGAAFERRRSVADRLTPTPCPACSVETAKLRMSLPAMVGAGAQTAPGGGVCPSSGAPCGCAHAVRN